MLHVEKAQLLANNALDISRFRATELQYYIEHIGSIQTAATLIAGFAFTAFLSMENVDLDVPELLLQRWLGGFTVKTSNGTTTVDRHFVSYDALAVLTLVINAVEVFSVCLCLVEMISVLLETLLARLLGSRLALKGQDGSIIIATKGLAKSLVKATSRFIVGLQWFLLSVVCHGLRGMHPAISGIVLIIIFTYWRSQFRLAKRLADTFQLHDAVRTEWDDERSERSPASSSTDPAPDLHDDETRRGCCSSFKTRLQNYFMLQMLLQQVDDHDGAEGIGGKRYHRPSEAARALVLRLQGDVAHRGSSPSRRQRHSGGRSRSPQNVQTSEANDGLAEHSSPMGDFRDMLKGLFGFGGDSGNNLDRSTRSSTRRRRQTDGPSRGVVWADTVASAAAPRAETDAAAQTVGPSGSASRRQTAPPALVPGWTPSVGPLERDSPV